MLNESHKQKIATAAAKTTYKFSTEWCADDGGDEDGSDHHPGFGHAHALLQGLG